MTRYELILALPTGSSEEERSATQQRIESVITKNGGSIEEQKSWGKRRLAYPIEKQREGFFIQIDFDAVSDGECLEELNRELRIAEDLLRSLVTKTVVGKSKGKPPSPEEMAKMNYRPPGSRRPPMNRDRDGGSRFGGPRRDDRGGDRRDDRSSAPSGDRSAAPAGSSDRKPEAPAAAAAPPASDNKE